MDLFYLFSSFPMVRTLLTLFSELYSKAFCDLVDVHEVAPPTLNNFCQSHGK